MPMQCCSSENKKIKNVNEEEIRVELPRIIRLILWELMGLMPWSSRGANLINKKLYSLMFST